MLVELSDDVPTSLGYHGQLWLVLDTPTRLGVTEEAAYSGLVTHPPTPWLGWRFIAKAQGHDSLIFEVVRRADGWELIRVYR